MKAQDMPMKTIVFVIIALIVIAVVVIWYMVTSGTIEASTLDIFGIGREKTKIGCNRDEDCPPGYFCNPVCDLCVPIGETCPS